MSSPRFNCNDQQLLTMMQDDLPHTEAESLLEHIENCEHCQIRLEELAGSQEDWQRVGDLADTQSVPGGLPASGLPECADRPVAWTESMARQLLSPPSHPEMLGRLGRYEVERLIGVGGMGVVFKAFDTELNRPVAVKLLAPYLASSGPARSRFDREARAAAAVVHQHVVPIHNVETERETPFLVMHYVAGESLQSRIERNGPLDLCEILRIGVHVTAGLAAAHQQGLVHRDIKPSNILLEDGVDRALITDFGLARAADDASVTCTGTHVGTPQYMSPEQAQGEAVDQQSDLFSLGSVLYAMCTGRPPFRAETTLGIMRRITDDSPTPIRELNPDAPDWLAKIVEKLMSKSSSERFSSAAEVRDLLEECLSHVQQPTKVELPASIRKLTERSDPKFPLARRSWMATLAVTAGALVAAIVYFIQTNTGVVRVEVLDPSLKVTIKNQTITVDEGNGRPLTLRAGPQLLVVQQGDTKFEAASFQLRRKEKVAFKVELLPGAIVVSKQGDRFKSIPIPMTTPDRKHASVAESERSLRRTRYISDMRLLAAKWTHSGSRAREFAMGILERYRDAKDLHGFEWGYWNRIVHRGRPLFREAAGIRIAVFSPNGRRFAAPTGANTNSVSVFDAATFEVVGKLSGHQRDCARYRLQSRQLADCDKQSR